MPKFLQVVIIIALLLLSFFVGVKYSEKAHQTLEIESKTQEVESNTTSENNQAPAAGEESNANSEAAAQHTHAESASEGTKSN